MHNVKQELGIKKNVFKLTIYVTYNKTSNTVIIYYTCTKTIDAPGHPKPPPPQSPTPWGMTQVSDQKSCLISLISYCENTHKHWYKNL